MRSRPRTHLRWAALPVVASVTMACTPPGLPDPLPPDPTSSGSAQASGPTPSTTAPTTMPTEESLTVGLDGTVVGFNPYAIADAGAATTAVAALTLPSVSVVDSDGTRRLDPDVITSAAVTSTDPFTVTYEIAREASWSDGTPVTAEDFRYLRDQLSALDGVRSAAPYGLITGIDSAAAGKQVTITFGTPVADWQSMFSPLLPAHILKDAPGGFLGGLADDVPVTAGPYRFASFDRVTGQITLRRNDKYWADQPGPAGVVLRLGTPAELVAALGRGDVQAVFIRPGHAAAEQLSGVVARSDQVDVPLPSSLSLVLDTTSGPTASLDVRRAVAAGLVPEVLQDSVTGSRDDGLLPGASAVRLPATGSATSWPDGLFADPTVAADRLAAAGWRPGAGHYVVKDGVPLSLTLGYPAGDAALARTARMVQSQLGRIGIEVDVVAATDLVARLDASTVATDEHVDLALLQVPRDTSDGIEALSSFGCPVGGSSPSTGTSSSAPGTASETTPGSTSSAGPTTTSGTTPTTSSTTSSTTQPPTDDEQGTADLHHGANLSGWCDESLQTQLVSVLSRDTDSAAGRAELDDVQGALQQSQPVIPLGRPQAIFAVAPALRPVLGGDRTGWAWSGPLAGLPDWDVPG